MDLFSTNMNLLPYDGEVNYYGPIMNVQKERYYFNQLLHRIEWRHDEGIIFGKRIITPRKIAWYGDANYDYTYLKTTKTALSWTPELRALKTMVEQIINLKFNACLLNLYHNGNEGVAWHSDDEKSLGKNPIIAAVSFGANRKFSFKHKNTNLPVSVILEKGSLLVMKGATQANWLHRLPITKKVKIPRVSLTFRTIIS